MKIYGRHTQQATAVDMIDHVIDRFPFRIYTVGTDNSHEFQARFHWQAEDLGIRHVYIRPATSCLNGKVERSHETDQREFYPLLEYKDDIGFEERLSEQEKFYNLLRPHGAHKGKPLTKRLGR